jgi:ABC-type lipoprotein release transport system permease subunit
VSALAMTGIKLTLVPSLFIVSISNGFKLMYQDKMAKKMSQRDLGAGN